MKLIQDSKNPDKGQIVFDDDKIINYNGDYPNWFTYVDYEKLFNSKGECIYLKIIDQYFNLLLYPVKDNIIDFQKPLK